MFVWTSLVRLKASSIVSRAPTTPERKSNLNTFMPLKRWTTVTTCGVAELRWGVTGTVAAWGVVVAWVA
jgi:hypothetical protein